MEATKWLKPSRGSGSRKTVDSAKCAGRNASERRSKPRKGQCQADPTTLSGKGLIRLDEVSEARRPAAAPG